MFAVSQSFIKAYTDIFYKVLKYLCSNIIFTESKININIGTSFTSGFTCFCTFFKKENNK